MDKKAFEKILQEIYQKFGNELLKKLQGEEELTSSDLNVIRQFLKDNNVDIDTVKSTDAVDVLSEIEDELFSVEEAGGKDVGLIPNQEEDDE